MVLLWAVVARGGPGVEEWIWLTSHRRYKKTMFSYPEVVYAFVLFLRWENKDMCEAAEMFDWVTLATGGLWQRPGPPPISL